MKREEEKADKYGCNEVTLADGAGIIISTVEYLAQTPNKCIAEVLLQRKMP